MVFGTLLLCKQFSLMYCMLYIKNGWFVKQKQIFFVTNKSFITKLRILCIVRFMMLCVLKNNKVFIKVFDLFTTTLSYVYIFLGVKHLKKGLPTVISFIPS